MTDIKKTIEQLKALEAGASPCGWEISQCTADGYNIENKDGGEICSLHNHAPWDRKEQAYNAQLIVAMRNALPELLPKWKQLEARAEIAEVKAETAEAKLQALTVEYNQRREAVEFTISRAEKAEAERDVLARYLESSAWATGNTTKDWLNFAERVVLEAKDGKIWWTSLERERMERESANPTCK